MTVVPIQERVRVRVTPRGARFFELLRDGYDEASAMKIARAEHTPRLVRRPGASTEGGKMQTETEMQAAGLRARIEKQIARMLTAGRELLQATRVSKARAEFLEASRKPGSGGTIQ